MARCKKCDQWKGGSDFYKSEPSVCKECIKARVKANRLKKAEQYRQYEKGRAMIPHRVEARKAYQQTERGKEVMLAARRSWQRENPEKRKAHSALNNAVRDGKVKKEPCWCGRTNVHGHHDDYSKPLDVRWLCPKHHRDVHNV